MFKKLIATAALATALSVTGQAGAITIDDASYTGAGCIGAASCVIGGATLTAGPAGATFSEQNFGGAQGLGINFVVTGGARDLEIQGDPTGSTPEEVAISFATAQVVNEIQLAHFYNPVHFPPNEPAEIANLFHDAILATLQVLDDSGNFIAVGFDPGATFTQLDTTAGLWRILNPFGSTAITSLVFQAANTPTATDNSDYTIALVETSDVAVPEPTTLGLLGIGLIGLGLVGRRFRRSAVANK